MFNQADSNLTKVSSKTHSDSMQPKFKQLIFFSKQGKLSKSFFSKTSRQLFNWFGWRIAFPGGMNIIQYHTEKFLPTIISFQTLFRRIVAIQSIELQCLIDEFQSILNYSFEHLTPGYTLSRWGLLLR